MSRRGRLWTLPAWCLLAASCRSAPPRPPDAPAPAELVPALRSLSSRSLLERIRKLASDRFEGRAPGTRGETRTLRYLVREFKRLGLEPAGPGGSWLQAVPLLGVTARPEARFASGAGTLEPRFPDDFVALTRRGVPEIQVDASEVVFVGYGIVAPEFGWDDYKGVDCAGKTLVMLVNDPPVPDPSDPSRLDERVFGGKAMTYYGRWTYKYEIASARKAAAAVLVHETGPAGYPWEVVQASMGRENFDLKRPGGNPDRVAVEAWVSSSTARRLFELGGLDFEALKKAAASPAFKPVSLGTAASFRVQSRMREIRSANVAARIAGSDPGLKGEHVVYTAHWDHLGMDPRLEGDRVYNGARDNASGTAALLELAGAFKRLARPPRRSVLFLSTTAEEKGLLGAAHYAENPLVPLEDTLAVINMDGLNVLGRTRDVVAVGLGLSTLDDTLVEAAWRRGRKVLPDPEPEKGTYYRSDHFEFAKRGVPALLYGSGTDFIGKPSDYGMRKREEYTQRDYHKVSDEVKPEWDLSGAIEDLELLFEVGWRVAEGPSKPEWKPGAEFRAKRESSLRKGR